MAAYRPRPDTLRPHYRPFPTVRVIAGAEFDHLSDKGRRIFLDRDFAITNDSNRMGFRLAGEPIAQTFEETTAANYDLVVIGAPRKRTSGLHWRAERTYELIKAIRAVHEGQTYLPASVAAALAAQVPGTDLSARELQVLEVIVRGLANTQIAYTLNIAEHTVKNHVKNILSKLAVQDRTQAATAAIQRGIVHLP